jgi:peroxiredoxin
VLRTLLVFLCLLPPAFAQQAQSIQRPLPDVPIPLSNGKTVAVKQYKGKVVVIVMLSTTCESCKKTVEILSKAQTDFAARGLQVIGAAIDDNAKFSVERFVKINKPTFPIGYLDHDAVIKLADTKPPVIVPVLIFVDRTTQVRFQVAGNDPIFKEQEKAVRAIIDSLLQFSAGNPQAPVKTITMPAPKAAKQ